MKMRINEPPPHVEIELPNGTKVAGRIILVGEPVSVENGGHIRQEYDLHPSINGRIQVVAVLLDPTTSIILPGMVQL